MNAYSIATSNRVIVAYSPDEVPVGLARKAWRAQAFKGKLK